MLHNGQKEREIKMKKYFITYCDYPEGHKSRLFYETHTKPRFIQYCNIHGFEFNEINSNIAAPYNLGFAKVFWIQQNWDRFNNGDVITYMDIDCCIVNGSIPAIFDADFAIVKESTNCLCMGGTWSLRVSEWSKKFIDEMCSIERQEANKNLKSWNTWHENDAVYHVLGLNWGSPISQIGERDTTIFTKEELSNHVKILPVEWGLTYSPDDVDWTNNKFERGDIKDSDYMYKIIAEFYDPENYRILNDIFVRHLSGGTMYLDWANRYYNYPLTF